MKRWPYVPLTLLALLVWWPVWYLLMGAIQSPEELVFRWGQKYLELGIRSGTMEEV